ncbi:autotransporter domain-containing protein [Sebaldella sp. S0638]|uniref:autotransporter domain-containing protein n=1 Tax=Sebaldella sp. S0638 TaxID=2957809 RepID=UPI00209D639F|nr:autotransporter domain-containing protein [Sebaldella sp. S0638]MCP1226222.1 autotransporter domain-containing protein [Sebaldella sp. S0638]
MTKNQRLLMFLTLNSVVGVAANSNSSELTGRYRSLYRKMSKNMDKNISNDKDYKVLERILNQRNKELKDLYLQNDYIIKPEYLEWQVFFSGFYNMTDRKGTKSSGTIPDLATANSIDVSIKMPNIIFGKPDINLGAVSVNTPLINVEKNSAAAPNITYNNNVIVPDMILPEFKEIDIDIPTLAVSTSSIISSMGSTDQTYYDSGKGIFSNYNLESGDFTYDMHRTSSSNIATSFSYENAVGSIDPTGIANSSLNQPSVIPVSDSNSYIGVGPMMYSTSSPSTRIGENVNVEFNSSNTSNASFYNILLTQLVISSGNRSAINADPDYAYGGKNQYPGAQSSVPFSIMRNSGTVNIYGDSAAIGVLGMTKNQGTTVNDYLLVNDGTIIGNYTDSSSKKHIGLAFQSSGVAKGTKGEKYIIGNDGKMEFRAPESAAFLMGGVNLNKHQIAYNRGNVDMYGFNSIGVKIAYSYLSGSTPGLSMENSKILLEKPVNIHGDNSVGVYYYNTLNFKAKDSVFKVNIGTEKNSYSGNKAGNDPDYVEYSTGFYFTPNSNETSTKLTDFEIKFGDYAKKSTLILNAISNSYNMNTGVMGTTSRLVVDNSIVNSIDADKGQNNIVVYNKGRIVNTSFANVPILQVKPDINIGTANKEVNGTIALYNLGGIVHQGGNINTYGESSHGIYNSAAKGTVGAVEYSSKSILDNDIDGIYNSLSIITHGNNSAVLYNKESDVDFKNGGTYKALGENSAVLYNKDGNINITGDALLEAGNNGTLIVGDGGTINLDGNITYNVKNNSVFAYVKGNAGIKVSLNGGNQTLNLENGSIGFIYDGNSADTQQNSVYNYLRDNFQGLNHLDVNVLDTSRLFVLNNYGTLKLSDLQLLDTGETLFKSVNGNMGNSFLNKGILVLDTAGTINLDDTDNLYVNTEKAATGVTVNAGVTINGTKDSQIALAGKDSYRGTPGEGTYVVMNNYGNIELSGDNSLGVYTENGLINNHSEINMTGNNSAGLFGENGTIAVNNGNIGISDNGVGIYAVSYQNPAKPEISYGDGSVNVTNNGIIKAADSEKATGIYVNNNKTGALRGTGNLDLSNGTVDMSLSEQSTGVYAENVTVNGGGTIAAGESGIGIYAKESDLNLSGLTLNLNKNNSVGIYLDSGSTLNTSGTNIVNISGNKNILFYVNTDGSFNQNFVINGDSDSSYSVMYVENNKVNYSGTAVVSGNSTLFYGKNSSVVLDNTSSLISSGEKTVGIYVDGIYNNTVNYEGINYGDMEFGDGSAGMYAVNGARLLNEGNITLGNNSLGVSGEGSEYIINNGTIETGSNSIAMSAKDTALTENSGSISADGENVTGMYLSSSSSSIVENKGEIELAGKNTIGVYLESGAAQVFNNSGTIKTESTDNTTISSAGIYNNNHTVNNTGNILSGANSLGIYNNGGIINHSSGSIVSEAGGLGIYSSGGEINLTGGKIESRETGIYAQNNTKIVNTGTTMEQGDNSKVYVLESGSTLENNQNAAIGNNSIFLFGHNAGNVVNNASLLEMKGANSIGYYMTESGSISNRADITGLGTGNIGIYSDRGSITNTGNITLGDSEIIDKEDSEKNKYSVGIYGKGAEVNNASNIKTGSNGTGIYVENNKLTNSGKISSDGEYAIGLWGSKAAIENNGEITMNGDFSQGIVGTSQSTIVNNNIITMNGNDSVGISGSEGTRIQNNGTINLNGNNSTGIMFTNGAELLNKGIINLGSGSNNVEVGNGSSVTPPSIINAGVIKVDGKFELNGVNLTIQVDPDTIRKPEMNEIIMDQYMSEDIKAQFLASNSVHFTADSFDFSSPAMIDTLFTQGTNALAYKFENVFMAKDIDSVKSITVDSHSVTFKAIPSINENGNADIWMEKIPYQDFTKGSHYNEIAGILDENYVIEGILGGQTGEALELYDKLDLITNSNTLGRTMGDLTGEMYSNTTRRMEDVSDIFADSMNVLQSSENNTKENVKINVIAGKGKTKENRDGVLPYDYSSVGVIALREVERTYRHTFGYSLGYLRTDFEFDGTNNEDEANTIQLGLHNKYKADGWGLKTDFLGRVGFNSTDREIEWENTDSSKMNGSYNTYGVSLLNEVSKDFETGKNTKIVPYAGLKLEYGYHTDISENGAPEKISVDQNYYYSIKPKAGVELRTVKHFGGSKDWKAKMNIGVGYEYELGDTNRAEKAALSNISQNKFELGKSGDDKGKFTTNGEIGVEFQDRYGVFLTGKYKTAGDNEEDYQIGLNLKAAF